MRRAFAVEMIDDLICATTEGVLVILEKFPARAGLDRVSSMIAERTRSAGT